MAFKLTAEEVKSNFGYRLAKCLTKALGNVGAGALAGAAATLIPTEKLNPIQKFCIGAGIYGISKAAGYAASDAIERDFDDTVDAVCALAEPITQVADLYKEAEKKEETEDDEVVDEVEPA